MRFAEQLHIEPDPASATAPFRAEAPLDSRRDPFASGAPASRLGRPAQTAFGELVRLIGLRTRVVVVLGNAGTGKTVLVGMVARACADMGLSVRRIERGDLLTEAAGDTSDVLFVDEADSMSNAVLQSFLSARDGQDRTMVFMCLPSCISRFSFSGTDAVVLELSPLSLLDARLYLTERGNSIGRPNLFTPQALDLIIDASRGVPRLLRTIAGLAYFNAAAEGASQIDAAHAEAAARMRNELAPAPSATLHAPSPCSESPCSEPADIDLRPEFPPADPDDAVVEASPDAPDSPAEDEPQSLPYTEVFAPMEAARDSWPLPSAKSVIALGIVLLIAGAGGLALISGRSSPEIKPQAVTPSPAIAAARPAEAAASQPSSETAPATIAAPAQSPDEVSGSSTIVVGGPAEAAASRPANETAPATVAAPTKSTLASASASRNNATRPAKTDGEIQELNICALRQSSRDPRALPVAGRCPGASLALPGRATRGSSAPPPAPRAAEAGHVTAEPIRTTDSTPPLAQNPTQVQAPPPALRSDTPAIAADKVPTPDPVVIVRAPQDAAEQNGSVAPESDRTPVIIFGYRLW